MIIVAPLLASSVPLVLILVARRLTQFRERVQVATYGLTVNPPSSREFCDVHPVDTQQFSIKRHPAFQSYRC